MALQKFSKTILRYSLSQCTGQTTLFKRMCLDLPLADGIENEAYLQLLKSTLPQLLDKVQPDFVFYLCGVDIVATDKQDA